jgi:O-antigen ligase
MTHTGIHRARRVLAAWPGILVAFLLFAGAGAAAFLLPESFVVAIMAVVAVVLAWMLRPDWVIVGLLLTRASIDGFMELFTLFAGSPFSMNLSGAINSLAVGLGVLTLIRRWLRREPLLGSAPARTYALFLLVGLLSLFRAVDAMAGVKEWARLASGLAICLMVGDRVRDERGARRMVVVILLSSVVPLALALLQRMGGGGYFFAGFAGTEFAFRPEGTFSHPAMLGSYLIILLTLAIGVYFSASAAGMRVPVAFWAMVAAGCLVLTMARAQWLGMMVAVLVVGMVRKRRLALAAVVAVLVLLLAVPLLRERLTAAESVLWRVNVWRVAAQFTWPPSLLGRGLASSGWYINQLLPTVETHPHNDYLKVGLEQGVLGLLTYAAWLVSLLAHAWRSYRGALDPAIAWRALSLLGVVVAGLVISMAGNYLGNTAVQWYFWALVALVPPGGRWPQ